MFDKIRVGDRVEITLRSDMGTGKRYASMVEEIRADKTVLLQAPKLMGQSFQLSKRGRYSLLFQTEGGASRYRFDASIVGYMDVSGYCMMIVKILNDGMKVQRREFYRIDCKLPVKFTTVDENNEHLDDQSDMQSGIVRNISGGGMAFTTKHDMEEDVRLCLSMVLNGEHLVAFGRVVEKKLCLYGDHRYQYNLQFHAMPDADQEIVIGFIFDEQRKVLRKNR